MTTATTSQTAREWLAAQTSPTTGKPLALAGPGVRGRFSKEANEALTAARASGVVFADDVKVVKVKATDAVVSPAPATATVSTPAPVVSTPAPQGTVNAKDARAWAKANGIAVGERGRLHPDVIAGFLAATGTKVSLVKTTSTQTAKPVEAKPAALRKQTVAYGRIARKEGDGLHITEPILAIMDCYKCKQGVSYCACKTGPRLPKWAGASAATFDVNDLA